MPALLQRQADRYGDRALFVCGGVRWSYADVRKEAARTAGQLAALGVARGDRVALLCGNRPELLAVILGCGWLGAIAVPVNVSSRGMQLQHVLDNARAVLLVADAALLPVLDGITLGRTAVRCLGEASGTETFPHGAEAIPPASVGPGDPFVILYTSGTTGPSKGVLCPHAQFFWWGVYSGRQLGIVEGDVLHTPLPLFHTNALNCFFQALLHGATQVLEAGFSVSRFWDALAASGATVTYLLGAMVPMLLSRPPDAAERAHRVRVALAPGVPAAASAAMEARTGVVLLEGFGTTESNVVIAATPAARRPGTCGRLVDGFEARVADADDSPVPDGEAGELLLRAREPYAMALGYWNMPAATVAAWRNLWLHTGDRVVRDGDGYFRFVDRMKDAIRRRGENISSWEVEQVLLSHPAVALAAVFPVLSDMAEDEVMAAIVLHPGHEAAPETLVRFCEGKLARFAIPRFIDLVAALPRTENGKVQKYKLREQGRTAATWDRDAAGITLRR